MIPSRHDAVTMNCPLCDTRFAPSGRRRYCSDACRAAAYRRRHQPAEPAPPIPPPGQRRAATVYQCPQCDTRALGTQRCDDCGTFMARVGSGGLCPCCDEPITIDELTTS